MKEKRNKQFFFFIQYLQLLSTLLERFERISSLLLGFVDFVVDELVVLLVFVIVDLLVDFLLLFLLLVEELKFVSLIFLFLLSILFLFYKGN